MLTVAFINVLWTIDKIASKYIPVKMKTQQSSLATDTVEKFLQKPLLLCTFQSMHFKTVTLAAFLKKFRFIFAVLWRCFRRYYKRKRWHRRLVNEAENKEFDAFKSASCFHKIKLPKSLGWQYDHQLQKQFPLFSITSVTKLLNLNTCSYCLLLFLSSPAGTRWKVRYINYSHISNKSSASFADWKEEVVGLAEMTASCWVSCIQRSSARWMDYE